MSRESPAVMQPPEALGASSSRELLVTYTSTNGEEQCAIVRIDDDYEEMLAEACLNLAPWLPPDWQNRRRDFAREVRNLRGDTIWAVIQPSLVVELAKMGNLPELRLRIHPPSDVEPQPMQSSIQATEEQSPAYEANPRHSAVDGIVQAVLHRLYNENSGYTAASSAASAPESPMTHNAKARAQAYEDDPHASEFQAPESNSAPNSPEDDEPATLPNIAIGRKPTIPPPRVPRPAREPENNQLPTPQSPPPRPAPWSDEPIHQTPPTIPPPPPPPPPPRIRQTRLPLPPVVRVDPLIGSVGRALQLSSKLVSEGKHEAAIRALRSACGEQISSQERAQLFLWLGQVDCEIMEYMNASCDTSIARDIFTALEDRAGRIECDIVLARIARERTGVTSGEDTKLVQLLGEARRHDLQAIEVQILCEICRVACSLKDPHEDLSSSVERAKAIAQRLGDTWLKAESSRVAGMVSETQGDYISALQAYSSSVELYRGAKAPSPMLPVEEVEADIQRMRVTLSRTPEKPKSRFRKFF